MALAPDGAKGSGDALGICAGGGGVISEAGTPDGANDSGDAFGTAGGGSGGRGCHFGTDTDGFRGVSTFTTRRSCCAAVCPRVAACDSAETSFAGSGPNTSARSGPCSSSIRVRIPRSGESRDGSCIAASCTPAWAILRSPSARRSISASSLCCADPTPKTNSFRNASRAPGGVSTASPALPVRTPCRRSRESRPESRQSASPARPVRGRSPSAMNRQSASAAA